MNEPTIGKETWHVWTSMSLNGTGVARWCWVAYGPRGSQSGVEVEAESAVLKAQCAAEVLADPRRRVAT